MSNNPQVPPTPGAEGPAMESRATYNTGPEGSRQTVINDQAEKKKEEDKNEEQKLRVGWEVLELLRDNGIDAQFGHLLAHHQRHIKEFVFYLMFHLIEIGKRPAWEDLFVNFKYDETKDDTNNETKEEAQAIGFEKTVDGMFRDNGDKLAWGKVRIVWRIWSDTRKTLYSRTKTVLSSSSSEHDSLSKALKSLPEGGLPLGWLSGWSKWNHRGWIWEAKEAAKDKKTVDLDLRP
ncbi:hypothetical protein F4808DRAFT_463170 [Astrocystis sublimbata]|nr:hypothetical protein F4808DRAFT_463169 [Astrocystis sublimbata]KAI0197954.1 hypothetical protein F4808DRAFT_463170 [Astrocystis sublimbata]